jgi:hypothetical protein
VATRPIRPIIVVEAIPVSVDRGQTISLSARLFDKLTMQPQEVSRIYMTITSQQDGHIVWPLEVVRKNAAGFDIMLGTEEMKDGHDYLVRVSNNWNLSPSSATQFLVKKKATVLPIVLLPLIPIILPIDIKRKVKQYIFRTQMDHRVCPICKPFENRVYNPGDANIPSIPLHINCRCTMDIMYADPEQVTEDMRNVAQAAMTVAKTKVARQAISIINSSFY